jgi:hypothetical protein
MSAGDSHILKDEVSEDCERILAKAKELGVRLKLIGGLAVWYTSPLSDPKSPLGRDFNDIDLVGLSKDRKGIYKVLEASGFVRDARFNSLHGDTRLLFRKGQRELDVFLDKFEMCHMMDLRKRLDIDYPSINVDDLLFSKLQIVEITEKDMKDISRVLLTHELAEEGRAPQDIHLDYFGALCSDDWGIYKTLSTNLENVRRILSGLGLDPGQAAHLSGKIDRIRDHIEKVKKTTRWKLRATVGERARWSCSLRVRWARDRRYPSPPPALPDAVRLLRRYLCKGVSDVYPLSPVRDEHRDIYGRAEDVHRGYRHPGLEVDWHQVRVPQPYYSVYDPHECYYAKPAQDGEADDLPLHDE